MLQSDSLFASTRLYVEIVPYIKSFLRHLGIYFLLVPARIVLGRETQMEIPFGDSSLLLLVPRNYFCWGTCWNFPASASELIPFGARLDRFCYSQSPEIPFWGFLFVSPLMGFTLIGLFARNSVLPCRGFTVSSPFMGNYIYTRA